MANSSQRGSLLSVFGGLGWPLLLGSAAASVFYMLIFRGPLNSEAMHRYFAAHPVSFCATWMFFVGLAALLVKLLDVLGQLRTLNRIFLVGAPLGRGRRAEDCQRMLDTLEELPGRLRHSYLANRLYEAVAFAQRQGAAAELDEELKYLEDSDAARQQESYALVRIIIWATPMLGFLGTVVGITRALGDLDPQQLATSIQTAMEGLLSGLYVAFDTTALALSLSILLMFIQFFVDRVESQLLATVTLRASEELAGKFEQVGAASDPHLASVQQMADSVLGCTQRLVQQQAELWQSTIDAAQQRWQIVVDQSAQQTLALRQALDESLSHYAARAAETEEAADQRLQRRWEQWQTALSENARMMHAQQIELTRQGEVMIQVLQATGDVVKLEKSLNDNLRSLAGAKNFEDTVMSLAAAIHLLNARLGASPDATLQVDLSKKPSQGRAA